MRADSLRRRLLQWLLWPLVLVLVLGSAIAYQFALHAAVNASDFNLLDSALDLSKQVQLHEGALSIDLPPVARQMLQANNEDRVKYAAWDQAGRLFSGTAELLAPDVRVGENDHLFRDIVVDGEANREILLRRQISGRDFYIAVSETTHGRNRLTDGILASILVPEALLIVVSIIAVLLGVKKGLAPVQALRDEIASRSSADLRSIEETAAPAELAPIIHGINELLDKLAAAFAGHRRFIADAAHQLRTPLASLGGQIEVALERPPENTGALLRRLLETTQRTAHLSNQLLSLARLEHTEQTMYETVSVDLRQTVLDAAADYVTQAAHKGIDLDFDLKPCRTQGSPLMLRELCANLLDNAVRHTPGGGKISVRLQPQNHTVLLSVEDSGPGVPENELDKLGIPFHRLSSSLPDGCGLGLAIVKEIARLHAAEVRFSNGADNRGLRVEVTIGLQAG